MALGTTIAGKAGIPPRGLAARAGRIAVSATSAQLMEADRLRAAGRDLVDLGVGEPDFPTPDHIKEAGIAAVRGDFTKYTATAGTAELRDAICAAHARDFGSGYRREQALVTVGGKHALFNAISALVDHGDEVIVPSPYWVSFLDQIAYAGGTPVLVAADADRGFELPIERLAAAITPRTKVILLNSPANPSGAVLAPEFFAETLALCRQHGIWLLSDECYAKFVYDEKPYSVGAETESRDWVVIAGSLSKAYAMTGWRIGYALAPVPVIEAMMKLQSHSTTSANAMAQKAAVAALLGDQAPVARMLKEYRVRRQWIVEALRGVPGARCGLPAGAFYALADIRELLGAGAPTAQAFAVRLLREAGLVTVAGEAFGIPGHLRFSYAASPAMLREGLSRFKAFCDVIRGDRAAGEPAC